MFVVLTVQREEKGVLARAGEWLRGPLEVRRKSFLGNGYYHIIDHTGGRPHWELLSRAVGKAATRLVIAGEEADQVGIGVGRAYAVGYGVYSGLCGVIRVREFRYNVLPDYISGEGAADAEFTLELRPSTLLAGALILLVRGAATLLRGQRPAATTKVRR